MLENVVDQAIQRAHELDVHRRGGIARIGGPLVAPLVPGDPRMRVLHVDHEPHEAVPNAEWYDEAEYQQRPNRLAAIDAPHNQAAYPQSAEAGHQQAVPGVADAPRRDVLASREKQFLPPHFDHVVDALPEAAAINALQQAPYPRQFCEFGGRVRGPNVIAALEVGE